MDNSPDSVLDPIKMPGRSLLMKMDAAPAKMLATMTLMKGTPRKMSAVTETPAARDAMKLRYRAAMGMGSPFAKAMRILAMMETKETYEEDEDVGDTKLLPRRAAAVKPSPRRAAAAKLLAKGTTLLAMRQAARELGLGSDGCHDNCSPEMYCSPQMYCSAQTYCSPEMRAATKDHERFAYTPPLPQMEWELRYERCQDGGDTQMYDNYEMYESYGYARFTSTQSPLPPPVEDQMQDYKVLGAFSNLTALQPGPWNISSSVQCGQAALCTADSSSSVAGPVSCCLLLCSVESCRTTLSRLQASHHQAPRAAGDTWPGVPGVWT